MKYGPTSFELLGLTIKNFEKELTDKVKFSQSVENALELKLKEAIDHLMGEEKKQGERNHR